MTARYEVMLETVLAQLADVNERLAKLAASAQREYGVDVTRPLVHMELNPAEIEDRINHMIRVTYHQD